ncbi:MAG: TetR/AcrR family transcriptional regulator [Spirochaetales bacterium]|nr:TetR/AcrR family transcriptional regulator [Spirochaetales bacterium]
MKRTFQNLGKEKREAIIDACIREFGEHGYEKATTDSIIRRIGISKGGLYEYVSSKKELFLFIVEYTYERLYDYLRRRIKEESIILSGDILERIYLVSGYAIDFYVEHPEFVAIITKTYALEDDSLANTINTFFHTQFLDIFGDSDADTLAYEKDRVIDLLIWLLLKTRKDFLDELKLEPDIQKVKKGYMDNWRFYISVLREGLYKKDKKPAASPFNHPRGDAG